MQISGPAGAPAAVDPRRLAKLLANDIRWGIVQALVRSDLRAGELVDALGEPANVISYHLSRLRRAGLVNERRSSADGRDIYYRISLDRLRHAFIDTMDAIHPALFSGPAGGEEEEDEEGNLIRVDFHRRPRVLFLCTHNSARSQIAEALLRYASQGDVEAYSAGSEPAPVHPMTLRVLEDLMIPTDGLHAKPVSEFVGRPFDYVITLCDEMREHCPNFPGAERTAHWSCADPVAAGASPEAQHAAFRRTAIELEARISYLLILIHRQEQAQV